MAGIPQWVEVLLLVIGIVMALGMMAAVPLLVVKLPADYFVRDHRRRHPVVTVARNVFGFVLVVLGIAMLVLPGQGILTILLGLSLVDLPIKDRMLKWVLSREKIRESVQKMRSKYGKEPLLLPA